MNERTATAGDTENSPAAWPAEIVKQYAPSLSPEEARALESAIWRAMMDYGDICTASTRTD